MRRRILRWSILGFFLALALAPDVARASDCPPDDPSRADCIAAASTARSPLVPIAGAAAGGIAAWVVDNILDRGGSAATAEAEATGPSEGEGGEESPSEGEGGEEPPPEEEEPPPEDSGEAASDTETEATGPDSLGPDDTSGETAEDHPKEEQQPTPKNPCAADEAALVDVLRRHGVAVAMLNDAKSRLTALESLYNRAWWAGFGGGMLDVGFFGLSAWAPELGESFFKSRVKSIILQKLGKEIASAIAKEVAKQALNAGLGVDGTAGEQAVSMSKQIMDALGQTLSSEAFTAANTKWGLLGAVEHGALPPIIERVVGKQLASQALQAPVREAVQRGLDTAFSNAVKSLNESFGTLFGAGWSLDDMWNNVKESHKQLDTIVKLITAAQRDQFEADTALQDAIADEASARRVLEHCRHLWSQ